MNKTVLLIATFDTKSAEALYLKAQIEALEFAVLTMDAGILKPPGTPVDIDRATIAQRGGTPIETALAANDKGAAILNMMSGVAVLTRELYEQGRFGAAIGIGGAQGTDIATAGMRALPIGVPKFMVSTVASGQTPFGPFVGTRDVTLMHSVADIQGLNFLTRRILKNAAGAVCGMLEQFCKEDIQPVGLPVAMSMMGTTTPGSLYCKKKLEDKGFEIVTFHQNGTGGVAMDEMVRSGAFRAVLDLSLHEVADRFMGGLHGAIRADRLEAAADMGIPQVVVPGGVNYMVLGPLKGLSESIRSRKLIVHNPNLTLVRLTPDELSRVGKIVADKLNRSRSACRVFIPLKGFSYPDRDGLPHWEPEGNRAFIESLKNNLKDTISIKEIDAHINDPEFMDHVVESFLDIMAKEEK
ncbi:MAG: Tm-1-like ATP-binding domain-containing protein [Desulfobacterales bacterium]|nr:Tm-1-like ATP-binding domain-containing protein [Desulfobacterales bacterium]